MEIERWKKRYMETEVRLKEFDEINLSLADLQVSYRRLQSDYQSLQSDYQRIQDENQRYVVEIRTTVEERDRISGRIR
jgi:chromosome segregation ATPase